MDLSGKKRGCICSWVTGAAVSGAGSKYAVSPSHDAATEMPPASDEAIVGPGFHRSYHTSIRLLVGASGGGSIGGVGEGVGVLADEVWVRVWVSGRTTCG